MATVNMCEHKWAERPRRQHAFGIVMPNEMRDLKQANVREALHLFWCECEITEEERSYLRPRYEG
jgi:hypothetical protein